MSPCHWARWICPEVHGEQEVSSLAGVCGHENTFAARGCEECGQCHIVSALYRLDFISLVFAMWFLVLVVRWRIYSSRPELSRFLPKMPKKMKSSSPGWLGTDMLTIGWGPRWCRNLGWFTAAALAPISPSSRPDSVCIYSCVCMFYNEYLLQSQSYMKYE